MAVSEMKKDAPGKALTSQVDALATLLNKHGLGEICVQSDGFSLILKAKEEKAPVIMQQGAMPTLAATAPIVAQNQVAVAPDAPAHDGNVMKSPIVGTFYSSPAPDKPAFVSVGSKVKKGDTIFIIESMKLMNEIQSDFDGEVKEILVTDGEGVEFHQPIMVIK